MAEFVIDSGLPVRNALSETSATPNHKNFLRHLHRARKIEELKLVTQVNLDSITDVIF